MPTGTVCLVFCHGRKKSTIAWTLSNWLSSHALLSQVTALGRLRGCGWTDGTLSEDASDTRYLMAEKNRQNRQCKERNAPTVTMPR
jgi:hypothetical protein